MGVKLLESSLKKKLICLVMVFYYFFSKNVDVIFGAAAAIYDHKPTLRQQVTRMAEEKDRYLEHKSHQEITLPAMEHTYLWIFFFLIRKKNELLPFSTSLVKICFSQPNLNTN